MPLTAYRTLGRSGLAISPAALGTMTFGTARWGSGEDGSRAVFDAYIDAGGNFVDTADVYAGGRSEEMLGAFIAERSLRHQVVIATKAGFATGQGIHAGGLGARHLHTSVEASLRRLRTDHIDLFWTHVWDGVTPAAELLDTMATLIRAGKIRYWGMSNAPAWFIAQVATLSAAHAMPGPIALQFFYSLINRDIEDEHVPLAAAFGLGIVPWSPLAYGFLSGKYDRSAVEAAAPRTGGLLLDKADPDATRPDADNRLDGANPFGDTLFTERNWTIVAELRRVAALAGHTPAQVALAWAAGRQGVTTLLMGVSRPGQLAGNIAALEIELAPEHRAALDAVSAPAPRMLAGLFSPAMRKQVVFGGQSVIGWRA